MKQTTLNTSKRKSYHPLGIYVTLLAGSSRLSKMKYPVKMSMVGERYVPKVNEKLNENFEKTCPSKVLAPQYG